MMQYLYNIDQFNSIILIFLNDYIIPVGQQSLGDQYGGDSVYSTADHGLSLQIVR